MNDTDTDTETDTDGPSFADVMAACGSASHDGGIPAPELQQELVEVHPVVVAQFVHRWAEARDELGGSSAEHPQFRDRLNRLLSEYPHGYGADAGDSNG